MAETLQADEPIARRITGIAIERPRNDAPSGVPVSLRTAQHMHVSRGRFAQPSSRRIVAVMWVLSGHGCMKLGAQPLNFGPGMIAIYLPASPHRFWALKPVNE